jgi:hypothetical protein
MLVGTCDVNIGSLNYAGNLADLIGAPIETAERAVFAVRGRFRAARISRGVATPGDWYLRRSH